jgi:signal transduction histidine kinase
MRTPAQTKRAFRFAFFAVVIALIFVADTETNYEIAAAVFYAVVILAASQVLRPDALVALAALCVTLTLAGLAFSPSGNWRSGLINTGISIAAIAMITYLLVQMKAATRKAQDAQARLTRIARIRSLEGLTTAIAHEINQPLAAIVTSGNASQRWLALDPPNLDKARLALDRILDDANRASSIIAHLRRLTRGEPPQTSEFDFNDAVLEVVARSRDAAERGGIVLASALNPHLPLACADRIQVQQVIGNLLMNAIQATAAVPPDARNILITSGMDADEIVFAIVDSGAGMTREDFEHVFEPFWTTKEEGIGLGLSICKAIVDANGGRIWAEPVADGGAAFRFTIPAAPRQGRP